MNNFLHFLSFDGKLVAGSFGAYLAFKLIERQLIAIRRALLILKTSTQLDSENFQNTKACDFRHIKVHDR